MSLSGLGPESLNNELKPNDAIVNRHPPFSSLEEALYFFLYMCNVNLQMIGCPSLLTLQ